ncbi:MAG TPA: hypothetical protein VGH38_19650 [Bryobacteraceae bacterium]|jgi:uncharacterized protein (TIGR03437 family)
MELITIITFYATGEGQTNPAGQDGKIAVSAFPKPVLPVTVEIGGQVAEVLYYGAAPGAVAGAFQVNAKIPDSAATGNQPLALNVGSCRSQQGVTVAVK